MKSDRHSQHGPNGTYVDVTHFSLDESEQGVSGLLVFENDGGDIVNTNYFDSPMGKAGMYYMSGSAGVVRLLVPDTEVRCISEMKSGKLCVITNGVYQGQSSIEVMFDDRSRSPFAMFIEAGQCDFRVCNDRARMTLAVWTRSGKVAEWPAYQRVGRQLPNLQPWK